MLTSLHISNYALIEHLDLDLRSGFSVITGETGAGKSIILGALGLLQGARADAKAIKAGAAKCVVEGHFAVEGLGVEPLLQAADIDIEDHTVIIRREITASGKSRTFINDTPANLGVLREVSACLIDIHSQHQNLLLTRETFLLDTLDCVAQNNEMLKAYVEAFRAHTAAERELARLREDAQRNQADQEFMAFQLSQIDEAAFFEGEQEELEEESATLSHAEEIKTAFYQTTGALQNDEADVSNALRVAAQALESVSQYVAEAGGLAERLESVRIEVEDVLSDVERAADNIEFNPERLAFIDERLSTLYTLQKKHRVESITELQAIADELRIRLDEIENADEHIAIAEKTVAQTRKALQKLGDALTESRKEAAHEVEKKLIEQLHELGMPNAKLLFEFSLKKHPDATGFDSLRFLFSANKNISPQDVAQTASGGEIARLMLSLKALIAQKKNLPTIIFDEIDTGVSGNMAERMGRVMQLMGQRAQVICITHLPQIAALGLDHYRVHKQETETGTSSHISPLSSDERVQEVAVMLSGAQITDAAMANARELLKM